MTDIICAVIIFLIPGGISFEALSRNFQGFFISKHFF